MRGRFRWAIDTGKGMWQPWLQLMTMARPGEDKVFGSMEQDRYIFKSDSNHASLPLTSLRVLMRLLVQPDSTP